MTSGGGSFMARARVERLVAYIARAINARALYGPDHPQLHQTAAAVIDALQTVCDDRRQDSVTILLFGDELVVDDRPLRKGGLHQQPQICTLQRRRIERLTLGRGMEAPEFGELIDALASGRMPDNTGHVILGTLEIAGEPVSPEATAAALASMTGAYVQEASDAFVQFRVHGPSAITRLEELVWALMDVSRSAGVLVPLAPLRRHDEYTFVHSVNVATLVIAQARSLGLEGVLLHTLGVAALPHDVGKMAIPLRVLNKPGRLDGEEWRIMQTHAELGARKLAEADAPSPLSILVAYEHHLRFDRQPSYPRLHRPRRPTLASQLTSVADVYDAICTVRPYRKALSRQAALRVLRDRAGIYLDPFLVGNSFRLLGEETAATGGGAEPDATGRGTLLPALTPEPRRQLTVSPAAGTVAPRSAGLYSPCIADRGLPGSPEGGRGMAREASGRDSSRLLSRRTLIQAIGAAAGAAVIAPRVATAQAPSGGPIAPPSTVTSPPRDFGPGGAPTTYFTDPDIVTVDPLFDGYVQPNSAIKRLWTGALWSEGPAWSGQGRYLVWSDIPNNRQLRWLEDDGGVSLFRSPSNNSNGNTFDFQGRQLSCEHLTRRVVRYEHDGSVTVIADSYNGKRFNSPNDIVPHPDGSYWFTDPPYGGQLYEGAPDAAGGPSNAAGRLKPRLGQAAEIGAMKRELPTGVYRVDPSGRVDLVAGEDQVPDPNGLVLSPDSKKLYVVTTGKGPGDTGPGGKGEIYVFDVGADNKLSNYKLFSDFMIDGVKCGPDGVRCDVDGNLWCSSNAGRAVGYSGVTVWTPAGKLLGRIRLPEVCGNVCFGGPKRNRLFMAASQSLYAVYVNTQGAAPG